MTSIVWSELAAFWAAIYIKWEARVIITGWRYNGVWLMNKVRGNLSMYAG